MSSTTHRRGAARRTTFFALVGLLLSLGSAATAARAQGFSVESGAQGEVTDQTTPLIRVKAIKDRQVYDTVEAAEGGLRIRIRARGQCPEKFNLRKPSLTLYSGSKQVGPESFPYNTNNRSLGPDHGQGWNYYDVVFPYLTPQSSPAAACNNGLKQREALGESRAALLQRGFTVNISSAYVIELTIDCDRARALGITDLSALYKDRATIPAAVRCMPTGYAPTTGAPGRPGVKADPPVAAVTVSAEPAETKGRVCPVTVNFRGRIVTGERLFTESVKVKYRFVGDRGFKTDYYEETLGRGQTRPVFWKRTIQAPAGAGGQGQLAAPGVKPRLPVFEGWMMLEVLHADGLKRSEKASFTVDCNPAPQRTPPPRRPRLTTRDE